MYLELKLTLTVAIICAPQFLFDVSIILGISSRWSLLTISII